MTYSVTTDYRAGMPQTRKNALPYRLIACHDTEGGTGVGGALGTIRFLIDRADRNASYHELWAYEPATDAFSAIRIVPPTSCAHSINPNPPPNGSYEPDTWVRQALGAGFYDPNQGVYAVSIAGKVADVDRYAAMPKFVGHALRRLGEIRAEIGGLVGLAEHFRFTPSNRTDWGRTLTPKLGGLQFADLPDTALPGEDMQLIRAITGQVATAKVDVALRREPSFGAGSFATLPQGGQVIPFAVVKGDAYRTGTGTSDEWLAYVGTDTAEFRYLPAVTCDLSAISADCSAEVEAAKAPLLLEVAGLKTRITTIKGKANNARAFLRDLADD